MSTKHSNNDLKNFHNEAIQFFVSQLTLLKAVIPQIKDERLAKAAILLISCGQTGSALLQLASQIGEFSNETTMLARSFMEKIINFCYVGICEEKEYRAFILHPIYKHFHLIREPNILDHWESTEEDYIAREKKQNDLKKFPIVQEALELFSDTKANLNWTKTTLNQRIKTIEKWGKCLDIFLTLSKMQYYSDASEALHGSLYGCTFSTGALAPGFTHIKPEEIDKKLLKDRTCVLLHQGMIIHEAFTLISYSNDIREIWDYSYKNRGQALNLLFHVLEKPIKHT